jgi:toxin ParE1/3/4
VGSHYVVRPKVSEDLDEQAFYLAKEASAEIGHRFLIAAHETFNLLATQPEMGWHPRLRHPSLTSLRVFRISGFDRMLILYRPIKDGVEIIRVIHGSRDIERILTREGI